MRSVVTCTGRERAKPAPPEGGKPARYMQQDHPDYIVYEDGRVWSKKTHRFLRISVLSTKSGHLGVNLDRRGMPLQRLLYETWVGDVPLDWVVDHIDQNPLNNSLSNLRPLTKAHNNLNRKTTVQAYNSGHKWWATVKVEGVLHYSGMVDTREEALAWREATRIRVLTEAGLEEFI